jgi:hypothetical protein
MDMMIAMKYATKPYIYIFPIQGFATSLFTTTKNTLRVGL